MGTQVMAAHAVTPGLTRGPAVSFLPRTIAGPRVEPGVTRIVE